MAWKLGMLCEVVLLVVLVLVACSKGKPQETSFSPPSSNPPESPTTVAGSTTGVSPTTAPPSVSPTPGAPSTTCLEGWVMPQPGTALRKEPLDLIRLQQGVQGLFVVAEMRYFEGPELPWIGAQATVSLVKTWYVKAYLQSDPSFRGRWLVQRRTPRIAGIAAVAPYTSTGFRSPDWRSFEGEGPSRTIPGLPGTWPGPGFDSVTGAGIFPALTRAFSGCLAGTGPIQTTLDPRTPGLLSAGVAHVEVTGGFQFAGDLTVEPPSAYIGRTSFDVYGMDITWGDRMGDQLVLSGSSGVRRRTSSRLVLGLALKNGKAFFLSKSGECTVTSEPHRVRGSFACTGLSASGVQVDARGDFSGS